ncbi:MAG: HAD family hydrolase [Lachnospiraceae bacterium]|nr:HAD family hydrolase [Lachnospiraceae bacterium]MBD5481168.1 HAD family hydrolase [Lachnospiraceae bacterium]
MLKKPKMIWFDYGQTLVKEANFNGVKGTEAVLQYAVTNKYDLTAAQVQAEAEKINQELGRFDPAKRHLFQVEVPNHMFTAYLYESLGIQLSIDSKEIDRVFWDAAGPGTPTEGIESFLEFLYQNEIRTGVLSNISYAGTVVEERISRLLPNHHFEFIIATSEYMYRKPHKRIFEFILEKSELRPEDVWYIGDQYQCDVVGAKSVGIFPIWYRGAIDMPYEEKEDVLKIADWKDLQAMLT